MAPGKCENCHKRQKFGTHRYCGKTCAAQAAAKPTRSTRLQSQANVVPKNVGHQKGAPAPPKCTYCGQKPRFSGFDYCGKSCAALAAAGQTKPPALQGVSATKQKTMRPPNAPPNNAQVPAPAKPHKAPRRKVPVPQGEDLDYIQVGLELTVDLTPDDSAEEDEETEGGDDSGISTDLDAYPSDSGSESEDEPNVPVAAVPQPSTKSTPRGSKLAVAIPKIAPGICAIPGCGQPSHVDRNGVKTAYCSIKHREEAVKLGLEEACIMCKRYPQSASNYFCSSTCRNQSMTKT